MKRFFTSLCTMLLTVAVLTSVTYGENDATQDSTPKEPEITSGAALVMDGETGAILYQKNMTDKLAPADTVQILTVLLGLESGKAEETVTVSKTKGTTSAWQQTPSPT